MRLSKRQLNKWGLSCLVLFMLLVTRPLVAQYVIEKDTVRTENASRQEDRPKVRPQLGKPTLKGAGSIFRFLPDENSESSINFSFGVESEWTFLPRLHLLLGANLFFINQNFPVGIERVQGRLANGSLLAREHVSTDISITGIEIPLGVKYEVGKRPGSLFVEFMLLSRTSLKERYTDHIDWKMGGTSGGNFIANSVRSTEIRNESTQAFEFFNVFHAGTLSLGKSIHVYGEKRGEIQINYTFHIANMKNIFQEARFKKFEGLGISFKIPLRFLNGR